MDRNFQVRVALWVSERRDLLIKDDQAIDILGSDRHLRPFYQGKDMQISAFERLLDQLIKWSKAIHLNFVQSVEILWNRSFVITLFQVPSDQFLGWHR